MGLLPSDVSEQYAVELWPDTEEAILLFCRFRTQWRMGFAGPVSLDYAALEPVMRLCGIQRRQWAALFDDIRVMERTTLDLMRT
jgi:hypothetical protein